MHQGSLNVILRGNVSFPQRLRVCPDAPILDDVSKTSVAELTPRSKIHFQLRLISDATHLSIINEILDDLFLVEPATVTVLEALR